MIYKYDDIVKTTEERYIFQYVGAKDIGKAITIKVRDGNARGGYITKITDSEITCMPTIDIAKTFVKMPIVLDAKFLYDSDAVNICIYDPNTGQHDVYDTDVFVKRSKEKREFNTDVLKPGAEFYMEANGRCGIVTVLDCGKNRVCFKEDGFIDGVRHFNIEETPYDLGIPNPIQLKTLDELTCYDLVKRGFNGYGLKLSTASKLRKILSEEEVKPFGDEEDSTIE